MLAYSQQSDPNDRDHSSYLIGRPIVNRATLTDEDLAEEPTPPSRKSSISQVSPGLQPNRNAPIRPVPPQPSNARRSSVPSAHHRSSSSTFGNPQPPSNPAYISNDDLYSRLDSFTFGAARETRSSTPDEDAVDPFTNRISDQRPRRSLSSVPTLRDDEVDDEAGGIRDSRAKMRAIDDGTRRPSLPNNEASYSHHRRNRSSIDTTTPRPSVDVDRSSVHTFGFAGIYQRTGASYSDEEDDEIDQLGEASSSPVVFANSRQLFSEDEEDDQFDYVPIGDTQRRGSLPMIIPGSVASADSGRDSLSIRTRRKLSRSLDDDISMINHGAGVMLGALEGGTNAYSEPLTRGEWSTFDQQYQRPPTISDAGPDENIYEGLNLEYIFGEGATPDAPRRSWDSSGGSFVQPQQHQAPTPSSHFGLRFIGGGNLDSRRPSAATIGEDTFFKHVRTNDANYASRLDEWTFGKEKADGPGLSLAKSPSGHKHSAHMNTIAPGMHEIWRCQVVGRFTVERITLQSDPESTKAPQHRLKIRHITDPYSANKRGGPSVIVHKHSRALAFSIFRSHELFKQSTHQSKSNARLDTSNSILLATKKVQEMYTSTKTTNKLKTHGLLEDNPRDDSTAVAVRPRTQSSSRREKDKREKERREREKAKKKAKEKDKGKDKREAGRGLDTGASSQTTSHESIVLPTQDKSKNDGLVSSWVRHLPGRHISPPPSHSPPPSMPSPPSTMHVSSASTSSQASESGTWDTSISVTDSAGPFRNYHPPLHASSSRVTIDEKDTDEEDDMIDEYHLPVQRRSHAETYDSLTPIHHEHARRLLGSNASSGTRRFKLFNKRSGNVADWPPSSPTSSMVPSPVPWMLVNNSEKVEEGQVVMTNLNDNFGAVGLVPPRQPNRPSRPRPSRGGEENMLLQVPDDSLYMVLPLFAGETDPEFMPLHMDMSSKIPLEQRKYLLVYYVPFGKISKSGKKAELAAASSDTGKNRSVFLPSFRVSSHLMTYKDFRGSGVRLPDQGLSVTGPLSKATPPDVIPDIHMDAIAIAQCTKREIGIEFLPEGLHKLGLCQAEEVPPIFDGENPEGSEIELRFELSAIGRAVVEMAWMGAMAVTSFGSV